MTDRGTILVVDDEPRNVKLLASHLKSDGFKPITADNGKKALELAASKNPDVILLDVMMPDMDGFEVTRRLKADSRTQHIPVVLVTSLDGSDNRVKGLDAGADEFLTKPVNRTELLTRVRALQRMKHMQDELQNRQQIAQRIMQDSRDDKPGAHDQHLVLIVEDDERMHKQLSDVLSTKGYQTMIVNSAATAREVTTQYMPDLILLDLLLPDADGLQLLNEWKALEPVNNIPVIIMTSVTDLQRKVEGLECGADDYLIKPIDSSELLARVRAGLRRASSQQRLLHDVQRLQQDTVTDRLTGVRNRYYLDADLEHRFAQASRDPQRAFSLIMLDIDNFKHINDRFGHLIGDSVLREVAACLKQAARAADIVTRYGGEEFCVILADTGEPEEARLAAERLRKAVEAHDFDSVADERVTVSAGLATYSAADTDVTALLARADTALYAAKESGRNRVCMAKEPQTSDKKEGAAV